MTELHVLQEGRARRAAREAARRRRRRRRRVRRLSLLLVLAAAVLLAAMAAAVSAPPPPRPAAGTAATGTPAGRAPTPGSRTPTTATPGTATPGTATPGTATPRTGTAGAGSPGAELTYARAPAAVQVHPRLKLGLRSGLLFDVRTGRVLWARKPTEPLPIASLTKMMTALVVIRHSKPSDRVLVTKQALNFSGSGVGLLPLGKRVSEKALLYGLLLPSGNDAAIALAQHVAGSRPRFVGLMNREAAKLGLTCSHFSSVSGLNDRGNYACAIDLAILAHAVLTQPTLGRIVASRSAILPFPIRGGHLYLYNNNPLLLERFPGADGVKTGYTSAAGLCLVAAARRGRAWLGVVLLHSANWTTQATTLLDAGFAALRAHSRSAR